MTKYPDSPSIPVQQVWGGGLGCVAHLHDFFHVYFLFSTNIKMPTFGLTIMFSSDQIPDCDCNQSIANCPSGNGL